MAAGGARVLVVDDEAEVRGALRAVLRRAGHEVLEAPSGADALRAVGFDDPDAVILDVLMPGESGFTVLGRIRQISDVPVLMLTARASEPDRLRGLGAGADDYVTKPFSNAELLARLAALLRRRPPSRRELRFDDGRLTLDLARRRASADGLEVRLSETEWALLVALVREEGRFVPVRRLLDVVWGDPLGIGPERVKFAVLRLRRRLGWSDPGTSPIESRRGAGYRYRGAGDGAGGWGPPG